MGTQSRELVPHISVYYEITLVRIRIMGGSKIHAHMAQLFVVIHTLLLTIPYNIVFGRGAAADFKDTYMDAKKSG